METWLLYFSMVLKYTAAAALLFLIVMAPAYLARQTKKDKTNMGMVRLASWTLGWTLIGWLWALFKSTRK